MPPRGDRASASPSSRLNAHSTLSGKDLESIVGRYGTLVLAALVILMAVGAVIKMAVERGLLTPEVRVMAGVLAAVVCAGAGVYFRGRGDVRYGNVLLAISLAIVDLVAWGAGPRLHLVPTTVALAVVDVAAVALAALALADGSEFLFGISVAGALSAPFVTSDGGGTALALLLYGGTVLAASLRAARDPEWISSLALLFIGALVYAVAATDLPHGASWYSPHLIAMFAGVCALGALLIGEREWRSELPRAYLLISLVGEMTRWKVPVVPDVRVTILVSLVLAAITHAALVVRGVPTRAWVPSALLLPLVSLQVAYSGTTSTEEHAGVLALWGVFSLVAWRVEQRRGEVERGGAHLLAGALLIGAGIAVQSWPNPLALVTGLAAWGVCVAFLSRDLQSPLPILGVLAMELSAALSVMDQLASRADYSYTPFRTRSSASAAVAAVGIGLAGECLRRGIGLGASVAERGVRLGALIGFLIVWGRMELAGAFNHDLASFLLTSYYAACGVASIIVGRRLVIGRLRVAGLVMALYAALKAVVEVTDISSLLLRVGAYAAVGVFLLGAGYLYREAKIDEAATIG